jgi:hypothetical protein
MGADDAAQVTRRGVVDRIEEEVAVVFLEDGHAAFLPRTILPPGSTEGSGIELSVRLRPRRREGRSRADAGP